MNPMQAPNVGVGGKDHGNRQREQNSAVERLVILRKGDKVVDKWYPEWGVGTCVKALKTRFYIKFADQETRIFDKQHLAFLKAL